MTFRLFWIAALNKRRCLLRVWHLQVSALIRIERRELRRSESHD